MRAAPVSGRRLALENPAFLQFLQPVGQDVRSNALARTLELAEGAISAHHYVAHNQQRPAVADKVERHAYRAAGARLRFGGPSHECILRSSLAFCNLRMIGMSSVAALPTARRNFNFFGGPNECSRRILAHHALSLVR